MRFHHPWNQQNLKPVEAVKLQTQTSPSWGSSSSPSVCFICAAVTVRRRDVWEEEGRTCSCINGDFFSSTGTADTKTVHQTPPFIIKRTGESLNDEIECSHRIENYEVILWYKTDQNGSLRFLGILNLAFPYPEEELKAKISFKGHGSKQSNLSVSDLQVSDAGVYYCAARRHSAADPMQSMQKPPFIFADSARRHLQTPPSAPTPESFYQPTGSPLTRKPKILSGTFQKLSVALQTWNEDPKNLNIFLFSY